MPLDESSRNAAVTKTDDAAVENKLKPSTPPAGYVWAYDDQVPTKDAAQQVKGQQVKGQQKTQDKLKPSTPPEGYRWADDNDYQAEDKFTATTRIPSMQEAVATAEKLQADYALPETSSQTPQIKGAPTSGAKIPLQPTAAASSTTRIDTPLPESNIIPGQGRVEELSQAQISGAGHTPVEGDLPDWIPQDQIVGGYGKEGAYPGDQYSIFDAPERGIKRNLPLAMVDVLRFGGMFAPDASTTGGMTEAGLAEKRKEAGIMGAFIPPRAATEQDFSKAADVWRDKILEVPVPEIAPELKRAPEKFSEWLQPKRIWNSFWENAPLTAALAGAYVANPAIGNMLMMAVEGGSSKAAIDDYEKRTGEKLNFAKRKLIPITVGAVNAALETTGIETILGRNKAGNIAKGLIAKTLVSAGVESSTEAMQELSSIIGELGYDDNAAQDISERLIQSFYGGLVTGGVLSGAIPSAVKGGEMIGKAAEKAAKIFSDKAFQRETVDSYNAAAEKGGFEPVKDWAELEAKIKNEQDAQQQPPPSEEDIVAAETAPAPAPESAPINLTPDDIENIPNENLVDAATRQMDELETKRQTTQTPPAPEPQTSPAAKVAPEPAPEPQQKPKARRKASPKKARVPEVKYTKKGEPIVHPADMTEALMAVRNSGATNDADFFRDVRFGSHAGHTEPFVKNLNLDKYDDLIFALETKIKNIKGLRGKNYTAQRKQWRAEMEALKNDRPIDKRDRVVELYNETAWEKGNEPVDGWDDLLEIARQDFMRLTGDLRHSDAPPSEEDIAGRFRSQLQREGLNNETIDKIVEEFAATGSSATHERILAEEETFDSSSFGEEEMVGETGLTFYDTDIIVDNNDAIKDFSLDELKAIKAAMKDNADAYAKRYDGFEIDAINLNLNNRIKELEAETKAPAPEIKPITIDGVESDFYPNAMTDMVDSITGDKIATGEAYYHLPKRNQNVSVATFEKMAADKATSDKENAVKNEDLFGENVPNEFNITPKQSDFITKKVKFLGSYDAVAKAYSTDSNIDKFARSVASDMYGVDIKEAAPGVKEKRDREIKEAEDSLIGTKIPGFFPTPKSLADRLVDEAGISDGMTVLEPSAGMGNIVDSIVSKTGITPDMGEVSGTLSELLKKKYGVDVEDDFLDTTKKYDRIVMNPPFEKGQDIDHVKHAYDLLKPGGRLVSIMSEGPFFRSDKQSIAFRDWLNDVGGTSEKLDAGSFKGKEAFRQTGVSSRIVIIDKPVSAQSATTAKPGGMSGQTSFAAEMEGKGKDMFDNVGTPPSGDGVTAGFSDIPPEENRPDGVEETDDERDKRLANERDKYDNTPYMLKLPDMVALARMIMDGKVPRIRKMLQGMAVGHYNKKTKTIDLEANLFKDLNHALKVLAHEIGHAISYLPDHMKRGNILGHIAGFKQYTQHFLPNYPGAKGQLTEKEKDRLRYEAKKLVGETVEQMVDEEIIRTLHVTPEDVMALWNETSDRIRRENKRLYDYIAGLSRVEKKNIIKEALKGEVPESLQAFTRKVREKTGRRIKKKVETKAEDVLNKYHDLVTAEIKRRALWSKEVIMDELRSLTMFWRPFDPNANPAFTKYRYRPSELFADALSVLMLNPSILRQRAPNFYKAFFNYIENRPYVKAAWDNIQDTIKHGKTTENLSRKIIDNARRLEQEAVEKARAAIDKRFTLDDIGVGALDIYFPLQRHMHNYVGEIPDDINPMFSVSEMEHIAAAEYAYGLEFDKDIVTKMLENNISQYDLHLYAIYKRILGDRKNIANTEGATPEQAAPEVARLEKEYPAIKEIMADWWKLRQKYIVKTVKEEDAFSKEVVDKIANTEEYVFFDIYNEIGDDLIRKQIGSFRELYDSISGTVAKDFMLMRYLARNKARKDAVKYLLQSGAAKKAEYDTDEDGRPVFDKYGNRQYKESDDPNIGMISYMHKGKLKSYYVPDSIAGAFARKPIDTSGTVKFLHKLSYWANRVAVLQKQIFTGIRLGFFVFNMNRDFFDTVKNIHGMTVRNFVKDYVKAYPDAFKGAFGKHSDKVMELLEMQALIPPTNYRGWRDEDVSLERLLKRVGVWDMHKDMLKEKNLGKKSSAVVDAIGTLLHPVARTLDLIGDLGTTIEWAPKIAANEWLKRHHPEMSKRERGWWIREGGAGSPNFMRHSATSRATNILALYSNPAVRGWQRTVRRLRDDPVDYMTKTLTYLAPDMIIKYGVLLGMFDGLDELLGIDLIAKLKAFYRAVSQYNRVNYNTIPLSLTPDENGNYLYLRQPRDESGRMFGGIASMLAEYGEIEPIKLLVDYTAGQVPSLNPALTALKGYITFRQTGNIYDGFKHRYVLSDDVASVGGARAEKEVGKWIANALGIGIIKRFDTSGRIDRKTNLEKILGLPIAEDVLGRLIKVSNYGYIEEDRFKKAMAKKEKSRSRLLARDAVKKTINGDVVSTEEVLALRDNINTLPNDIMKYWIQRYGTANKKRIANARGAQDLMIVISNMYGESPFEQKGRAIKKALTPWRKETKE